MTGQQLTPAAQITNLSAFRSSVTEWMSTGAPLKGNNWVSLIYQPSMITA
jgi:hypothetical protein